MTGPLRPSAHDHIRWRVEVTWPVPEEVILHVRIAATPAIIEGVVASIRHASADEGIHRWLARFLAMPDLWRRDILTDLPRPPATSGTRP